MLDKIIFACLLLLIFSIPFELDFGYMEVHMPLINTNLELIALILFIVWGIRILRDKKFPKTSLDLGIFLFIAVNILSSLTADNPLWSLKYIMKVTAGILLFYLIIDVVKNTEQIKRILNVLVVSVLIVSVIGFVEKIFIHQLYSYSSFWPFSPDRTYIPGGYGQLRISSTFLHPNILSMYVEIILFILISLFLSKSKQKSINKYLLLIIILTMTLIFTYSRAGLIGFLGGLAILLFVSFKTTMVQIKKRNIVILLTSIFILMLLSVYLDSTFKKRINAVVEPNTNSSGQRLFLWQTALKIFKEHPVLGAGPDNFRWIYIERYSAVSPFVKFNPPAEMPSMNSNSLYFESLANTGIAGTIVFIYLATNIFLVLFKNVKVQNAYLESVNLGLVGAFSAYFIHGVFDCFGAFQSIILLFWILAALVVKIQAIAVIPVKTGIYVTDDVGFPGQAVE